MPPRRPVAGPSSQATQRRRPVESESEDESEAEVAAETQATQSGAKGGLTTPEIKAAGAKLVRHALFSEYRRQPMRRDQISKAGEWATVIPDNPRAFPAVLLRAQAVLRTTFGMELVELRPKRKGDLVNGANPETQATTQIPAQTQRKRGRLAAIQEDSEEDAEEEPQPGSKKKGKRSEGTKSYMLRSILPGALLEKMAEPNSLPIRDDHDISEDQAADEGALLRWDKGDGTPSGHVGLLGLRMVVLCLVLCLGRVIGDDHLHALLKRLNLQRDTHLPFASTDSHEPTLTLDKYLDLLAKQNYLEKAKLPPDNAHPEGDTEWKWGSRADAEVSEKSAARFVQQIFLDQEESDDSEAEGPDDEERPSLAKRRKKLQEEIERAAGGPLQGNEL